MIWLALLFTSALSFADEPVAPVPAAAVVEPKSVEVVQPAEPAQPAAASGDTSGEYEIDYEEEPEATSGDEEAPEEAPVAKKSKKKAGKKVDRSVPSLGSAVSGTRSKNKFAPILNSDLKSVYHRNGKALDVDTD